MLTCTSCGNIINEGDKFCQYCGTPVVVAAPAPVVVPVAPALACTHCGAALDEGDKFCQVCGTPTAALAPTPVVAEVVEAVTEPVFEEPTVVFPVETVEEIPEAVVEDVAEEIVVEEVEEAVEEAVADEVIVEEPAPEVLVLEIDEEDVPEAEEECACECAPVCEAEPMGYDFPYLLRRKTRQVIDVNKAFFRIGSEKSVNNYVLEGAGGMHAMLMTTAGRYYIVDLGTEGKTYVNGLEITPDTEVELTAGCALRIADEDFVFIV